VHSLNPTQDNTSGPALVIQKEDDNSYTLFKAFYDKCIFFGDESVHVTETLKQNINTEITHEVKTYFEGIGKNINKIFVCVTRNSYHKIVKEIDPESFLSSLNRAQGGSMIKILGRQRKIVYKGTTKYVRYKNKLITVKEAKLLEKRS